MQVGVTGIGLWSEYANDWSQFDAWAAGTSLEKAGTLPAPEIIPKAERRRAPKTAKLAVVAAQQACEMAGQDIGNIASVFTSVLADTDITDQMCRALAQENKVVSPTKFHNSVQNAPAGYWAIGAQNHAPCTYISSFRECWANGLLEAATQCVTEQRPVLLINYDIVNKPPLSGIANIRENFASALLLEPPADRAMTLTLDISLQQGERESPPIQSEALRHTAAANSSANMLAQLEAMHNKNEQTLDWPLNTASYLSVTAKGSL